MEQQDKLPVWTTATIAAIIGSIIVYFIDFGGWYVVISIALGFFCAILSGDSQSHETSGNKFLTDWLLASILVAFLIAIGISAIGFGVAIANR